jgi:membrane protein DedA with SNARE-associated domain
MLAAMEEQVLHWVGTFSYPAVALLIAGTGVGLPVPEDLLLLAAGVVVAKGEANLYLMMAVGWGSVLLADNVLYRIGRRLGPRAAEHRLFKKVLSPKRLEWIGGHFVRHGMLTVFLARFVPGLRMTTLLVAGIGKMPMGRFVLAAGGAALISVPLLVFLGYRFGLAAISDVRRAGLVLGGVIVGAVAISLLVRWLRARRLRAGTTVS